MGWLTTMYHKIEILEEIFEWQDSCRRERRDEVEMKFDKLRSQQLKEKKNGYKMGGHPQNMVAWCGLRNFGKVMGWMHIVMLYEMDVEYCTEQINNDSTDK
jgi:hypothetical protein